MHGRAAPGHYRVLRAALHDDPARAGAGAEAGALHAGGIMAAITSHTQPQLFEEVEWSNDPYFGEPLRGYSSVLAIPLEGKRLPMNWAILLKRPPNSFTKGDFESAIERATLVCALLENQSLAEELARAHDQIDRDARQVGQLQRALLPASLPRTAGLEIATSYEPSGRAGGDLYDFFPLSQAAADYDTASRWCVFIGDASGHDLAAAVVMAIVQAVLRAHPGNVSGPAELLMHANRQLYDKQLGGFLTAFLGIYEPLTRRLAYANAGHPAPLLKRGADGLIRELDAVAGYPLGIDGSEAFSEATVQLETGDTLLLYTDGIIEVLNERGEWFERERLIAGMREARDGPARLVERLRAAVRAHHGERAAIDDQTLVAARVL